MKQRILVLFPTLLAFAVACSPSSPKREPPPLVYSGAEVDANTVIAEVNSKVDILFVVDNSESMKDDQANVSKYIDGFVNAFSDQTLIDFHVGVTTVYDTARQAPLGIVNGALVPIKDKNNAVVNGPHYVTRDTPDFLASIKNTLLVGVRDLNHGGPEHEESFSPVKEALTGLPSYNENVGFYRKDAYLMVIFLTDANDASQLSAEELKQELLNLKGNDEKKIMTLGVLFPNVVVGNFYQQPALGTLIPTDAKVCSNGNKQDPDSGPPTKIVEFLAKTNGIRMSLCDASFGPQLAAIGIDLSKKIGEQLIHIGIPDVTKNPNNEIKVFYGDKPLCGNDPAADAKNKDCDFGKVSWKKVVDQYGVTTIVIPGDMKFERKAGAKFAVKMVPVVDPNSPYTKTK